MSDFGLRPATAEDCDAIHGLITELAAYERMSAAVRATPEMLRTTLFGERPAAEAIMATDTAGRAIGFALFFASYSTFLARPGLWLEDLYVKPDFRGDGVGSALFRAVAQTARQRDCGRMEWSVLNWNRPAIDFYQRMGARPEDDWTTWRLTGTGLAALDKPTG